MNGFYLNLSKRADRREEFEKELKKTAHKVERFSAIDGDLLDNMPQQFPRSKRHYATLMTHLQVIKLAKQRKYPCVMVMEDDIVLCNDFDQRLEYFMAIAPQDWQILYLGYFPNLPPAMLNQYVAKVTGSYGCFGYIIKASFYDTIINAFEKRNAPCDEILVTQLQRRFPMYAFLPFLCYVKDDFSDIEKTKRTFNFIRQYYSPEINYKPAYRAQIPKVIHQIWLGDQSKRPYKLMKTWQDMNPSYKYKLWTEENLPVMKNQHIFDALGTAYHGKADILRYEILNQFGGIYIDADSKCVNPLDDYLLQNETFVAYENEKVRTDLLSNGYIGSVAGSAFTTMLIHELRNKELHSIISGQVWQTVGTQFITDVWKKYNVKQLKIYPSYFFMPIHYTGAKVEPVDGFGKVYAEQYWATTKGLYGKMN